MDAVFGVVIGLQNSANAGVFPGHLGVLATPSVVRCMLSSLNVHLAEISAFHPPAEGRSVFPSAMAAGFLKDFFVSILWSESRFLCGTLIWF